jgi:hypothetical protein
MKKILIVLICLFAKTALAQDIKPTPPVMTKEFADSLKSQISRVMPSKYNIKLLYKSELSADGKFPKPLIWREVADGTIEDNDFVQKMRFIIMAAPAWKPAFDTSVNKSVSTLTYFKVIIKNGKIEISEAETL